MNILLFALLYTAAILGLAVGAVVLARDYRRIENISYFGLSLGVACWAIGIANFLNVDSLISALYWAKFYYVAPMIIVMSSVFFAQHFMYKKQLTRLLNLLIGSAGVLFCVLIAASPTFITSEVVYRDFGKEVILDKAHYAAYGIYLLICFFITIAIIAKKRRETKYILSRQQINVFFTGFTISCVLGVYFNLFLPAIGNYQLIMVGPLATTFLLFSIAYAIIKHRLFDLRSFVLRALAYSMTYMLLSILYIAPALYVVGTLIMGFEFELGKFIVGTIVGTIAATYFGNVRRWFDRQTARIFFRDAYDAVSLISQLNRLLVSTANLNKMLQNSADLIAANIKIDFCTFALRDVHNSRHRMMGVIGKNLSAGDIEKIRTAAVPLGEKVIIADYLEPKYQELKTILAANNIAAVIHLTSDVDNKHSLGYMLLGYKKSGNPYSAQDVHTIETMADVLVIAIQNALHFEEIQNFNLTLQRRIDEATVQLRRTNAKLKALDETKDDFISMASHQLRTPLTSVKGYLSMVLEGDAGKLTALQRKMLDQAFVSSQRMVFLIADLLNVSRLKTGKFVIEPVPVNLAKTVADEVNQLKETAKNRSLELTYDRPEEFPTLMIDETKIRQVIMNFIDNAIYYTPAGGKIRVELKDTPVSVQLRIMDTGIGVPKREQPHLFTKFYRAGNARQARPDGTGLGLFMAKKVIVAQGGALIFESHEGKGSIFGFVFAKQKLEAPANPKAHQVT